MESHDSVIPDRAPAGPSQSDRKVRNVSDKVKMIAFFSIVATVTILALLQGAMAEGSKKVVPLIVAALGAASLMMWTIGVRGRARKR